MKILRRVPFAFLAISFITSLMVSNLAVRAADAAATATVIAGTGTDGPLVNDIPATSAQFWNPEGVTTTSDGTIYVGDKSHNEVRSIGTDGIIHAAFGDGTSGCSTGSTQTQLAGPHSPIRDNHDNIYVATDCGEIVEFAPGNPVGTVVAGKFDGTGNPFPITNDGTPATSVTIQPDALAYDSASGTLYFYDFVTHRVLDLANGALSFFAGTDTPGFSGDGGPAISAQLAGVDGMVFANGTLYISDRGNCRVRAVTPDGNVTTIAGNGTCQDLNDTGPGLSASVEFPGPLAMDANGVLYISGSLSGSIFAYDTQSGNIAPVIMINSNTTGLVIDPDGNLLALHSGVIQALYRITGLPSTTPPSDGLQHGRVTNVSWGVAPTTPLWNMAVTVTTDHVTCPAVAVVTVGDWQKRADVCDAGGTAPATTSFNWKVFNDKHSFTPGVTLAVTAFIAKSDAPHYGDASTTLRVPLQPTVVGVGDSYLSGHHQTYDNILCKRPDNISPDDTTCDVYSNDPAFSWVTLMTNKLNAKIPTQWQFDVQLKARSGATTHDMYDQGQIAAMSSALTERAGSWNVVAFDGGANNIDFGGALKDFYLNHAVQIFGAGIAVQRPEPWKVSNLADCPDTDALYNTLKGIDSQPGDPSTLPVPLPPAQEPIIRADMQQLLDTGRNASASTRFIDMLYPYTLKASNVCNQNHTTSDGGTWHGAKDVIDGLDTVHEGLSNHGDILKLDLRTIFSQTNPLPDLQTIRYYGYPHPDAGGQSKIAAQAVKLLKQ